MPVPSLQGNKSHSGPKTQSVGVLGLVMQWELPEWDLMVLIKTETSFLQQILHSSSEGRLSDKSDTNGYLGLYLTDSEQDIASQHGRSYHTVNERSTLEYSHGGMRLQASSQQCSEHRGKQGGWA